ncbi:uncharacterized protein LOC132902716 isoform X2 [Amyelois transitella]|uniref:uncharacterized protein LOC132902716 isoform X2 n=1 Tax=Amyelois transitella TaxID=680683 RepID=UPI00298F5F06|nr:uncharacterized protein LOC132902716 isoform X2 [Amyelois transitella]
MEAVQNEVSKLPQMVMCGDHPSVTKTDNAKEEKEKLKEKLPMSYARISPTSSSTDRSTRACLRAASEHAVRRAEARRRMLSADVVARDLEPAAAPDRSLVQALGSFRWPPYLLCVWVLVLLLAHALHALVAVLERAIPPLRKFCQYFRTWTEESWRSDKDKRFYPASLAIVTGVTYLVYFVLYTLYCVTVWAIEPLCSETDEETKVTSYDEDSKTNVSVKPNV